MRSNKRTETLPLKTVMRICKVLYISKKTGVLKFTLNKSIACSNCFRYVPINRTISVLLCLSACIAHQTGLPNQTNLRNDESILLVQQRYVVCKIVHVVFGRDVVVSPEPLEELERVASHRHVDVDHVLHDYWTEFIRNLLHLQNKRIWFWLLGAYLWK